MKAKDFDKKFDQGKEDIIDDLDLSTVRRQNRGLPRKMAATPTNLSGNLKAECGHLLVDSAKQLHLDSSCLTP